MQEAIDGLHGEIGRLQIETAREAKDKATAFDPPGNWP